MPKKSPPSPVITILGISGDLAQKKLLPALYHLLRLDLLGPETVIIGTSRRQLSAEEVLDKVELCVLEKDKVCDPVGLAKVRHALTTIKLDPNNLNDFKALRHKIDQIDKNSKRQHLFYMSVPASAYGPIVDKLRDSGLNKPPSRILLEKPFGYNLVSAESLIAIVRTGFEDNQVYRIDHYLAKETAQNLLDFRLHNPIFRPIWNCQYVERIYVRGLQTIGIEGRANFYEQTGALRDFVQSHLMQLLALTMMDIPAELAPVSIHAAKQHFFRSLKPAVPKLARRAQYDGYKAEVNNPSSQVETYVKLHLTSQASAWQDTDIILEHGKALNEQRIEVEVNFKAPHEPRRNSLIFNIQPDEGISLDLMVKEPGLENRMHHTALTFKYSDSFNDYIQVDAYERVLLDVVSGDQTLFASAEEVLQTWRVLDPLLKTWQNDKTPIPIYTAGSKAASLD